MASPTNNSNTYYLEVRDTLNENVVVVYSYFTGSQPEAIKYFKTIDRVTKYRHTVGYETIMHCDKIDLWNDL